MLHPNRNVHPLDEQAAADNLLQIQTGMQVVDAAGAILGTVAFVKMGDPEAATDDGAIDPEPAGAIIAAPSPAMGDSAGKPIAAMPIGPIDEEIAKDVPESIRARLVREGYVKIGGRFPFGKDRYVFPDQIASVGDEVKLRVNKEMLLLKS